MGNLKIPGFSDFLADMGEERIVQWSEDAQRAVHQEIGISFSLASQEDAQRFVTAMHALNQRTTILMLQDYHEWLIEKLDAASLHLI